MKLRAEDVILASIGALVAYALTRNTRYTEEVTYNLLFGEEDGVSRKLRKANKRAKVYARKWASEQRRADELETELMQIRNERAGLFRRMWRRVFG